MVAQVIRYAKVDRVSAAATGHLTLLTDQSKEPVFLRGRVRSGPAFAKAMLALGRVVKFDGGSKQRDHSAYQAWVFEQYLKEVEATTALRVARLPQLRSQQEALSKEIRDLQGQIEEAVGNVFDGRALKRFYEWLYAHNRNAWVELDPIVSVQDDATFFEAFSLDESVYGRVRLAHDALEPVEPLLPGTTNIDFGLALEREFARIRSYRPLELTVGADAVQVKTDVSEAIEKKIDLPESWVRGLVEVQSALMFCPSSLEVSPAFMAEILDRLEARRERHSPRSLKFRLEPGHPVSVEIEPWGVVVADPGSSYRGSRLEEVRLWGRRRLLILKDLLPDAHSLQIRLLGSGMPSFWTVGIDDVEMTLGLSGWTRLDWAGRARFSALMPSANVSEQLTIRSLALLKSAGRLKPDQLAQAAGVTEPEARGALQRLCMLGKAMFDTDASCFRWRELFPELDLGKLTTPGAEEQEGIELHRNGAVVFTEDSSSEGRRKRIADVADKVARSTTLETDPDGRVIYAACTCGHFRANRLRLGPCRHMVALSLS